MRKFDIMFVGAATRDENIDYTGKLVKEIGGAAFFGSFAAESSGADTYVSIKINPADRDIAEAFKRNADSMSILPSAKTTLMRNTYFTADRERRKAECIDQSDPILPEEIPDVDVTLYHLAGLLYGDFPDELIVDLSRKGLVSADIQGFLRHNENGSMNFHDWPEKREFLPYFDVLKTDAAEAEILTGTDDRRKAAQIMHDWGAKEILISHNAEMLTYDGKDFAAFPVKARNLSGRTGRGDTVFSSYLARRLKGDSMKEALLFATAAVSLKMEHPGPLEVSEDVIRKYIRDWY